MESSRSLQIYFPTVVANSSECIAVFVQVCSIFCTHTIITGKAFRMKVSASCHDGDILNVQAELVVLCYRWHMNFLKSKSVVNKEPTPFFFTLKSMILCI